MESPQNIEAPKLSLPRNIKDPKCLNCKIARHKCKRANPGRCEECNKKNIPCELTVCRPNSIGHKLLNSSTNAWSDEKRDIVLSQRNESEIMDGLSIISYPGYIFLLYTSALDFYREQAKQSKDGELRNEFYVDLSGHKLTIVLHGKKKGDEISAVNVSAKFEARNNNNTLPSASFPEKGAFKLLHTLDLFGSITEIILVKTPHDIQSQPTETEQDILMNGSGEQTLSCHYHGNHSLYSNPGSFEVTNGNNEANAILTGIEQDTPMNSSNEQTLLFSNFLGLRDVGAPLNSHSETSVNPVQGSHQAVPSNSYKLQDNGFTPGQSLSYAQPQTLGISLFTGIEQDTPMNSSNEQTLLFSNFLGLRDVGAPLNSHSETSVNGAPSGSYESQNVDWASVGPSFCVQAQAHRLSINDSINHGQIGQVGSLDLVTQSIGKPNFNGE